jgi:DNA-binding CsgD family transcriptional regulator/PAS domain-containing protein
MGTELAALSDTIGGIYDAAVDPGVWPAALGGICGLMGASAGTINYHDMVQGTALIAHEHGTDPHYSRLYLEEYALKNPLVPAINIQAVADPRRICDLIPYEAYRESELYRDWCAPQRYEDLIAACIYRDPGRIGALAIVRLDDEGRFSEDDVDLFAIVSAHVNRALRISNHLELRKADAAAFGAVVEQLATAVLLVDPAGWLLYRNEAARRLLAESGVGHVAQERLVLNGVDLKDVLAAVAARRFYETALPLPAGGPNGGPNGGGEAFRIAAVAVQADASAGTGPVAIFLTGPPGSAKPSEGFLKSAYRLTPAETRVVFGLFDGLAPADIATHAGASVATVRSQIASIREKTGARNQTDLIRLLASAANPVRLG